MKSIEIVPTGPATGAIYFENLSPIRVFGTKKIRESFDDKALVQARNTRLCPGVKDVVLTPDAHVGFGAPIGCVMVSPSHVYPGPVGVDINCSMSLLQFDLDENVLKEKIFRRAIIQAIEKRIPTGYGNFKSSFSRMISLDSIEKGITCGATTEVCELLGIPQEWPARCEDSVRVGHDGTTEALIQRLERVKKLLAERKGGEQKNYTEKLLQIGSYGGGNHFGECEIVRLSDSEKKMRYSDEQYNVAKTFGLKDGNVAFLSHCGSRGFGNLLARRQFSILKQKFELWGIPIPASDNELVYAPLGTPEANDYIDDMTIGANFAMLNHLVINTLILEAFQEIIPGVQANLVYYISHNIARCEFIDNVPLWIHRKGATRAYPAGHFSLENTAFAKTGHPILLPGNPTQGSAVMVALEGAKKSYYSVNHGAGRALGRREAIRSLDQKSIDDEFKQADILTNCRNYPRDEAPAAYKDFKEVVRSVEEAGLAREVARLQAVFVVKDSTSTPDD